MGLPYGWWLVNSTRSSRNESRPGAQQEQELEFQEWPKENKYIENKIHSSDSVNATATSRDRTALERNSGQRDPVRVFFGSSMALGVVDTLIHHAHPSGIEGNHHTVRTWATVDRGVDLPVVARVC